MGLEFLTQLLLTYKYAVIPPIVFVFGAPVSLVAGFLLRLDVLELLPTCLMLALGELAADVLWYVLGFRYGDSFVKRFGPYVGISADSIARVKKLFERRHDSIILLSKITAGLGFGTVIMFTAGLSRVPFRRYLILNMIGQSIWTAGLLSIGYFLGHLYVEVSGVFERMTLIALSVVGLLLLIGLGRHIRSRVNSPTKTSA